MRWEGRFARSQNEAKVGVAGVTIACQATGSGVASRATAAAAMRFSTPSFSKIRVGCLRTVSWLMVSRIAISGPVLP
jgi:hypothetical protein